MYLYEEEAKQKWCPYANVYKGDGGSGSRGLQGNPYGEHGCIASECMAWRWDPKCLDEGGFKHANPKGYCGLAGKPED